MALRSNSLPSSGDGPRLGRLLRCAIGRAASGLGALEQRLASAFRDRPDAGMLAASLRGDEGKCSLASSVRPMGATRYISADLVVGMGSLKVVRVRALPVLELSERASFSTAGVYPL